MPTSELQPSPSSQSVPAFLQHTLSSSHSHGHVFVTVAPSSPLTQNLHVYIPEGVLLPQASCPQSLRMFNQASTALELLQLHLFCLESEITGCASFNPSTIAEKESPRQNSVFLALPYLHTANVNGQHSSEEKHLQKEVRH